MKKSNIDTNTGYYFKGVLMYVGVVLALLAVGLIFVQPFAAPIAGVVSILLLTSVKGVELNLEEKYYKEYSWFLGVKRGSKVEFQEVSGVKMRRQDMAQKMHSRGSTTTIRFTLYTGVLVIDGSTELTLCKSKNEIKVVKKVRMIADQLGLEFNNATE